MKKGNHAPRSQILSSSKTNPKGHDYDPWEHAEVLGLDVYVRPLRTAHGLWLPDERVILIHSKLRAGMQRLVLAHEIGHADLAHRDDRPKFERQADIYAARNLIDPEHLADLYKWCPDERRIVTELGVTTRLFRAYVLAQAA